MWHEVTRRFAHSDVPSTVIPGVLEALDLLGGHGCPVCVVTARVADAAAVTSELEALGLAHGITAVLTLAPVSADVPGKHRGRDDKSHLFSEGCRTLQLEPGAARYVTDWPQDALSGVRFGFASTTGVLTGDYRRGDFPRGVEVALDLLDAVRRHVPERSPG